MGGDSFLTKAVMFQRSMDARPRTETWDLVKEDRVYERRLETWVLE